MMAVVTAETCQFKLKILVVFVKLIINTKIATVFGKSPLKPVWTFLPAFHSQML